MSGGTGRVVGVRGNDQRSAEQESPPDLSHRRKEVGRHRQVRNRPGGRLRYLICVGLLSIVWLTVGPSYAGTDAGTCAPGRWLAQYFTNKTLSGAPVRSRCEAEINHSW